MVSSEISNISKRLSEDEFVPAVLPGPLLGRRPHLEHGAAGADRVLPADRPRLPAPRRRRPPRPSGDGLPAQEAVKVGLLLSDRRQCPLFSC